ncbi:MAG: heavy-metal-associated domain-containing protein [Gemmatimonadetes bacterium]|nr:heavy-metal-associated domain-containing protein [Gemmatimonadota bacterium]
MASLKLKVSGMHCGHCTTTVERALKKVSGVYGVSVDLDAGSAEVDFDGKAPAGEFVEAVRAVGYSAEVAA